MSREAKPRIKASSPESWKAHILKSLHGFFWITAYACPPFWRTHPTSHFISAKVASSKSAGNEKKLINTLSAGWLLDIFIKKIWENLPTIHFPNCSAGSNALSFPWLKQRLSGALKNHHPEGWAVLSFSEKDMTLGLVELLKFAIILGLNLDNQAN